MKKYYGSLSPEPTALELQNRALARQAAAEGFVLLKNEGGALPLKSKKIALYGMGARKTVKGGLGSGSVEERFSVTIEEGLANAGYTITSSDWLDDYDREYDVAYAQWHDFVEEQVKDLRDMTSIIVKAHSYVFRYPSGRLITPSDVEKSGTDTALYVVMRQAGECNDRKLEPGDYFLTETETENLRILGQGYAHTILIINVGGLIDLSFLDEIPGIDAVVLFVQGGEEGGNALADVLSGAVSFSGKLACTVPMRYEDIPFGDRFSYLSGDLDNSDYSEGIYVGYRYFDSFGVPVRFPFGFGLSYTQFSIHPDGFSLDADTVSALVTVTNTGSCSGKEVVQLYGSAPYGPADREYQSLLAFAKTENLLPGQSQTLTLSFPLRALGRYDEQSSRWVLDAGDSILRIGNSSRDTLPAAIIRFSETVLMEQCRACLPPTDAFPDFHSPVRTVEDYGDLPLLVPALSADFMKIVDYTEPVWQETPEETEILNRLTTEEQAQLLRGGDLHNPPKGCFDIPGAGGKSSTALMEKGLSNIILSDGPAGINIVNTVYAMPDGSFMAAQVPERYNWGSLAKGMQAYFSRIQAPKVYRYATAWPVSMLQAQTWNTALIEQIGAAVGAEMEAFGVSVWLAPGMNIQKNPLGGRTFEYYSEDPVLSGCMAAALTKGVQRHPGRGVTLKHFCCNNIEDNRFGISANVSERALREIYLKGFEIAVKTAHPAAMMSSYNLVNHTYTANSHDLLTDILRCEWGFGGLVMTDWGSCDSGRGDAGRCAASGNDLIMPGSPADHQAILKALAENKLSAAQVRRCAGRVLRMILQAHTYPQETEDKE